jgi:hypothetical protein
MVQDILPIMTGLRMVMDKPFDTRKRTAIASVNMNRTVEKATD